MPERIRASFKEVWRIWIYDILLKEMSISGRAQTWFLCLFRLIVPEFSLCFSDSPAMQIAHRLESIMDYDRVVVMEAGEVVEDGVPNRLALDRNSSFYKLIYSTAQ